MRALWLAALLAACSAAADAASAAMRFCDRTSPLSAREQDRLLRFAAVARQQLDEAGSEVALVARSGLDLSRFGVRYSHGGISLKASANGPWSVRQLYYACEEGRPRLFDQGLAGFLFGTDDPSIGYLSIVLLPGDAGARIAAAAPDSPRALRLLAGRYSANAYPYGLRYQNCNQWLIELIAAAWGGLGTPGEGGGDLRAQAQRWLADAGYAPPAVDVGSHALMFAAAFIPWIHLDDHPEDDRYALRLHVSLPAAIEDFVHDKLPGARRIELCHDAHQVVVRSGWRPIAEGCRPTPGDRIVALD